MRAELEEMTAMRASKTADPKSSNNPDPAGSANKASQEALDRYPHQVIPVDGQEVVVWDDPVVDNAPPQSYAARTVALARQLNMNAVRRTPPDTAQPTELTLEAARARREAATEQAAELAAKKAKKFPASAARIEDLPPEPDFDNFEESPPGCDDFDES